MDNLAALADVTGPEILSVVTERFQHRKYYTYFGDFLLAVNPGSNSQENEAEVGQWYRKARPLQELPPHVMAIAHRAYQALRYDQRSQAILIAGRSASGKTEVARRLISQLLREANLSPVAGLGPRVVMAQHVLTTMITAYTPQNPQSTRGIKMATLYFRPDGHIVSAELRALCVEKWHLTERVADCGAPCVFYALLAGASEHQRQLYYLSDKYRMLKKDASRFPFLDSADHDKHRHIFGLFMTSLTTIGLDEKTRNYAGRELSAVLAILAAILHLGNIDVSTHAHSGHAVITNPQELRVVCDLMAVTADQLQSQLLFSTAYIRGEMVSMRSTVDQVLWTRDVLIVELYRRLLALVTNKLNQALAPLSIEQGSLTPIIVVESTGLESNETDGSLETFCRNMAAERLLHHLYNVIFQRDVDTCQRERLQPYRIKYADNAPLITAVFGLENGILSKLTRVSLDPQGTPEVLMSLMDNDRSLKKSGCYGDTGKKPKRENVFSLRHSDMGKVTYSARDFLSKNSSALPESSKQLLLTSGNPILPAMAVVVSQYSGYQEETPSAVRYLASTTYQSHLADLLPVLDACNLHYIRCLKSTKQVMDIHLDTWLVTEQLKECCVVETTRQRKYGYATCMTQAQFLHNYRDLAYSHAASVDPLPVACKFILQQTGLLDKGASLGKTSVFLPYWQVQRLLALKGHRMHSIILLQAHLRGFLARRRWGWRMTSPHARSMIGRFKSDDPQIGNRSSETYWHRNGYDRQFQHRDTDNSSTRHYDDEREHHGVNNRFSRQNSDLDMPDSASGAELDDWTLGEQIVKRVVASLPTLDPGTWLKIIYLERGKQLVKVYAEDKAVIIDGSHATYDGERLGLGGCRNPDRDEETAYYRAAILEGVRLTRDTDGSILACRLCDQPILVKGQHNMADHDCFSADVLLCRGQLPFQRTIKIFDMKEFGSKIALDLKQGKFSKQKMQQACLVSLSFGRDELGDSQTPCWLCIINVKAILALESEETIRTAQRHTVQLETMSPEEEREKLTAQEAKQRHPARSWARIDQRDHLQEREGGDRQVRQQLRAKGLEVGNHVSYSWQRALDNKSSMGYLHQTMGSEPETGPSQSFKEWEERSRSAWNPSPPIALADPFYVPTTDY